LAKDKNLFLKGGKMCPETILYVTGALAGLAGICPWGGRRPCPDPRLRALLGLVFGGITALGYDLCFLGTRAPGVGDLFGVAVVAVLLSHCIKTLAFPTKEA